VTFSRGLIEADLPADRVLSVAHYTKIGTLPFFLLKASPGWGSARATPVQFLNDRQELALGLNVLEEVADKKPRQSVPLRTIIGELRSSFGDFDTDAFQMSFSGNPDELGQWRGYAANGFGCSVVTPVAGLRKAADIAGWVLYSPAKQRAFARKILEKLRGQTDSSKFSKFLSLPPAS
jgi:hypothetical protein